MLRTGEQQDDAMRLALAAGANGMGGMHYQFDPNMAERLFQSFFGGDFGGSRGFGSSRRGGFGGTGPRGSGCGTCSSLLPESAGLAVRWKMNSELLEREVAGCHPCWKDFSF